MNRTQDNGIASDAPDRSAPELQAAARIAETTSNDEEQYWAARRLVLYRGCNPRRVPPDKHGTRRVPPDPVGGWAGE
jgi:hypothetical protein